MPDTADPAASALDEIRERWSKVAYVGLKPEVVPEPGHQTPWLPDVPRLLAAVEAALKLADEWEPHIPGDPVDLPSLGVALAMRQDCAAKLREAITAALEADDARDDHPRRCGPAGQGPHPWEELPDA